MRNNSNKNETDFIFYDFYTKIWLFSKQNDKIFVI